MREYKEYVKRTEMLKRGIEVWEERGDSRLKDLILRKEYGYGKEDGNKEARGEHKVSEGIYEDDRDRGGGQGGDKEDI